MVELSNPQELSEPNGQPRTTPPDEETEGQELISEILPQTAAGIAVLAGNMALSSWNPQAKRMTGYSLEEIVTIGLVNLFEPVEVMQHILRKVQDGIPTLSEYLYLRHADDQLIPVTVQCSPQRHLNRSDCQVVIAFRQLKPLQERLRHDEHLQMLGRLAGALSHEIRNPLNAIFLYADILEEELRQPTSNHHNQIVEAVTEIKAEISRLDDLVQDYLSLARLSDLSREPADLGDLVKAFGLEMHEQLESRSIALHLKDLDHLGEISLHRNAFRRVLLNLVQNAMDVMPHGGTLTLRGERTASQVRLEVSDTGRGIPEDQFPLLFIPFHTTKPEGTGLGLYVVQQIIHAHEGEIAVTSEPTSTTFTITLPLAGADTSSHT
jgi:two-component system sensor histidine kinase HydH